jgi:CHASE2 domain-containing sensor protein
MLGTLLRQRYRIIQALGSGGFGQTYLAEDTHASSSRPCVVKQLKPSRQDPAFLALARRLFTTEVATLRKLGSHDQIPALLDDFEVDQEFYLVQEYIPGPSLSQLLGMSPWSEAEVIALLEDVLRVLDFIHRHQVIHRDVKPSNIIRRQPDGKYVLIDFGAVKEIQTQMPLTAGQTDRTIGISTQGYGPSEQLMGKPRYSSDIYALGMTAIQALTGLHPTQLPSHPDTGEVIWQDQAIASPKLRSILDGMVRSHISQRYPSALAVLQALDATFMPTDSTQGPPAQTSPTQTSPTQLSLTQPAETTLPSLQQRQTATHSPAPWWVVGMASLVITGLVAGFRQLNGVQPLELALWDRLAQISANPDPDPRLLIVGITDADIAAQKQFPLSDQIVAKTLQTVQKYQPRAIGLALLRDVPQAPGRQELQTALQATNIIALANNFTTATALKTSPLGLPGERIGFNDFLLDADSVVRRNLLFADVPLGNGQTTTVSAFALQVAIAALATQGITLTNSPTSPDAITLGKATFYPLATHSGGYQNLDARGYQILMQYRGRTVAPQVSLTQLLQGQVPPEQIKDKIVLIGTTAVSGRDLFLTPYSAIESETPRMAGVVVYAQMLSQILSAALDGRSLLTVWSDEVELLWIGAWAIATGLVVRGVRRPLMAGLMTVAILGLLGSAGVGLFFTQHIWVPLAAPAIALLGTGAAIALYPVVRAVPPEYSEGKR